MKIKMINSLTVFFRSSSVVGEIFYRSKPCLCESCLNQDWEKCEFDTWHKHTFSIVGSRNPSQKDLNKQKNQHNLKLDEGEYIVKSIESQRVVRGKIEYLVYWEGYTEPTWVSCKKLNCDELLEDWEINNQRFQ